MLLFPYRSYARSPEERSNQHRSLDQSHTISSPMFCLTLWPRFPSSTPAPDCNPPTISFATVGRRESLVSAKVPNARAVPATLPRRTSRRSPAGGRSGSGRTASRNNRRRRQHRHRDSDWHCRIEHHPRTGSSSVAATASFPAACVCTLSAAVIVSRRAVTAVGSAGLCSGAASGTAAAVIGVGGGRFHKGFIL